MTPSAAFHLLSVGVTLRITLHIDLKFCIRSMERKMKQEASQGKLEYLVVLDTIL